MRKRWAVVYVGHGQGSGARGYGDTHHKEGPVASTWLLRSQRSCTPFLSSPPLAAAVAALLLLLLHLGRWDPLLALHPSAAACPPPSAPAESATSAPSAGFPVRPAPVAVSGFTEVPGNGILGADFSCPMSVLPGQCAYSKLLDGATMCVDATDCVAVVWYFNGKALGRGANSAERGRHDRPGRLARAGLGCGLLAWTAVCASCQRGTACPALPCFAPSHLVSCCEPTQPLLGGQAGPT